MKMKSFLTLGLVGLLLFPTGCIFSPDDNDGPVGGSSAGLPFPGSPDQLMKNFRSIYEDMDIEDYRNMLHPDYLTILKESTRLDFPEVGETLDYTEEIRIHTNMFSGAPGRDAQGNLTNPISAIQFDEPVQLTDWETSPATDPIPNALAALFEVSFNFERAGDKTLQVQGQIKFFITSRDSLHQGVNKQYYQMIGQWDFTEDEPVK
ncbi:hypothetical protein KJ682_17095 [bacterium]|nr:hypothetical protein [bacterium]